LTPINPHQGPAALTERLAWADSDRRIRSWSLVADAAPARTETALAVAAQPVSRSPRTLVDLLVTTGMLTECPAPADLGAALILGLVGVYTTHISGP
jgi:hypothetical protein